MMFVRMFVYYDHDNSIINDTCSNTLKVGLVRMYLVSVGRWSQCRGAYSIAELV